LLETQPLSRPKSKLRKDYKTIHTPKSKNPKRIHWFLFGLGVSLVGINFFLPKNNNVDESKRTLEASKITKESDPQITKKNLNEEIEDDPALVTPVKNSENYNTIKLIIEPRDNLEYLFKKNKIDLGNLSEIMQLADAQKYLRLLKPGDLIEINIDQGKVINLKKKLNLTDVLFITKNNNKFLSEVIKHPIEIKKKFGHGIIKSSLYESAAKSGLTDKLIMNLADIYAWDIDFVYDIRIDDTFYVLYEEIWQDGKYITDGEIIISEFNNNGRKLKAIRFKDKSENLEYFNPEGKSMQKAFLKAPVDSARISSGFNPNRKHPVLNTIRAHRGVDYAAPRGTRIKAVSDGTVIFRGNKGNYGKTIILKHGGNITTLYAHMSNYAKSAKPGRSVNQGQTIGYIGSTGLATGPHVHYEYRVNEVHKNPSKVTTPRAQPIKDEFRSQFHGISQSLLDELNNYKNTQNIALLRN
jgi:murein DD-endopeptidase MepM/ murein hydrolase activator NlpD